VRRYNDLAARFGLLVTGGTDFHGDNLATRVPVGGQYVPETIIEPIRKAAAGRRPSATAPALILTTE
jgi:hypothetical protein